MRKTLLLTAAVAALGLASASAQVYSVNVVGFVNKTLPPGFALVANPLNSSNNMLSSVLPNVPIATVVYKFDATNQTYFNSSTFDGSSWDLDYQVAPGEGFWIYLDPGVVSGNTTLTFVGEVPQGSLSQTVMPGFNLVGSKVPQAGRLTTDLQYAPTLVDVVYQFNPTNQSYSDSSTYDGSSWDIEPNLSMAEGIWLFRDPTVSTAPGAWTRTFNVQ